MFIYFYLYLNISWTFLKVFRDCLIYIYIYIYIHFCLVENKRKLSESTQYYLQLSRYTKIFLCLSRWWHFAVCNVVTTNAQVPTIEKKDYKFNCLLGKGKWVVRHLNVISFGTVHYIYWGASGTVPSAFVVLQSDIVCVKYRLYICNGDFFLDKSLTKVFK